MELTGAHLEAIKKAARTVEYGSVTIHISASVRTLDLTVENRLKIEKEPGGLKNSPRSLMRVIRHSGAVPEAPRRAFFSSLPGWNST
ncbi:MAG: hypothetical protein LBS57_03765 [Treponema sp.]|nr:hypothetical protein [Treponema sp.]